MISFLIMLRLNQLKRPCITLKPRTKETMRAVWWAWSASYLTNSFLISPPAKVISKIVTNWVFNCIRRINCNLFLARVRLKTTKYLLWSTGNLCMYGLEKWLKNIWRVSWLSSLSWEKKIIEQKFMIKWKYF